MALVKIFSYKTTEKCTVLVDNNISYNKIMSGHQPQIQKIISSAKNLKIMCLF